MTSRPDGRSGGGTLRPLACEMSCLQRADGSALWKAGSTHVLSAVYGPVAPRQSAREASDSLVTVLCKSGSGVAFEREWESFLSLVLTACVDVQQYPRAVIQILLQIIEADGAVLSCCLHAAVAALLDGGVAMTCLPVATTCLVRSGTLMLDPTAEEEQDEDACVLVLVNDSVHQDKILGCQTIGSSTSLETLLKCLEAASRASPAVVAFWRLAVEQKLTRQSQTLWST